MVGSQERQDEDTLGVIFPDEMVEKFGLKEGDMFSVVDTGNGIALRPHDPAIVERIKASDKPNSHQVIVQDFAKIG